MPDKNDKPRVRFAPSPTGFLHVGSARTALFNWLYACHTGGTYLLRIEDTDLERSTEDATRQIIESLEWLGLMSDEPIEYQTRRAGIHREYLHRLLDMGRAYRCYCPKDKLDAMREDARRKGAIFAYRRGMFSGEESSRMEAAGAPCVIRFCAPEEGAVAFDDLVYGRIEVRLDTIGDFVIARGDGSPLYNFTNVIDDIDMGITHICRGEDHISNTSKQILIYEALGAARPRFAHLPMILGADKQKLSKRHGATGVMRFREMGILPGALVNFLALLGWAPSEAEFNEVMSMDEIIARFSLDRINKSPAVFDHEKLMWMNGMHIRRTPKERLHALVEPLLREQFGGGPEGFDPHTVVRNPALSDGEWLDGVIGLATERTRTLNDFGGILDFFFRAPARYDEKAVKKLLGAPEKVEFLRATAKHIDDSWDRALSSAHDPKLESSAAADQWCAAMEESLRSWSEAGGHKLGAAAQPMRLALTGRTASPPLFHCMWYLGRTETVRRIEACARSVSGD
ncbi:MAG: glutamate--tRNA ligase [bacterium]|nr:glutamate--tRNA ligase [Candidatus Sumerlaeota bacterium]